MHSSKEIITFINSYKSINVSIIYFCVLEKRGFASEPETQVGGQ